jgi:hypothetical protein
VLVGVGVSEGVDVTVGDGVRVGVDVGKAGVWAALGALVPDKMDVGSGDVSRLAAAVEAAEICSD